MATIVEEIIDETAPAAKPKPRAAKPAAKPQVYPKQPRRFLKKNKAPSKVASVTAAGKPRLTSARIRANSVKVVKEMPPVKIPTEAQVSHAESEAEVMAPYLKITLIASDEEKAALVRGTLQPRPLAIVKLLAQRQSNRRPSGLTTGLPILMAWGYVFVQNEKSPDNKPAGPDPDPRKLAGKMTDEQIDKWMDKEFPSRKPGKKSGSVAWARHYYNAGTITGGEIPDVLANRYDEEGAVVLSPSARAAMAAANRSAENRVRRSKLQK